jgi:hypothetical protein
MHWRGVKQSSARGALSSPWWKTAEQIFKAEPQIKRRRHLLFAGFLVSSPLSAGQGGEGEGGSCGKAADVWRWRWSREVSSTSITSAAFLPSDIRAGEDSGDFSTSSVRPLLRLAPALNVGSVASGFVPAAEHGGGEASLWLDDGEREGPDCLVKFFNGVFSAIARDLYVICNLMGSFVTNCMSTVAV